MHCQGRKSPFYVEQIYILSLFVYFSEWMSAICGTVSCLSHCNYWIPRLLKGKVSFLLSMNN